MANPKASPSEVALCIADQLEQISYGICHNAAIEIRRLVPFEGWYEAQMEENAKIAPMLLKATQDRTRLAAQVVDLVDELAFLKGKHAEDRARLQAIYEHQRGECWYWQGDGQDHLESMVGSLPVVITAGQLRELHAQVSALQKAAEALPWIGEGADWAPDAGIPASEAAKPNIEAAAKALAECMDYPWAEMPDQGKDQMRKNAQAVLDAAQPELIALPVRTMSAPDADESGSIISEQRKQAHRGLVDLINEATDAIALEVLAKPDPCASCQPGLICKKPTCGRLEAQHSAEADAKDAARWRTVAAMADPQVTDFKMMQTQDENGEQIVKPVAVNTVRFTYLGDQSFADAVDAAAGVPKGALQGGV